MAWFLSLDYWKKGRFEGFSLDLVNYEGKDLDWDSGL